ncbi:AAA family ATPase [Bradyrhizobium erythrophlei]|jgi:SpoVK/Ycf46/Vps4 family AAA+-type ATPase|uniref:ATPase family associated with various cellular activities (AAA) n=1 Tax=Bradyrhizobium erythrophlei TaxID=1437360 RepID=A0A1M5LCX2_9BRAD|nr:AAA family ATPase [Bradyrhizobium erythrophlei]SHG62539.1 ATPase family associated with various cellular activities (AAA) [Bradyrhizobium erythrophlei]
MKQPSEVGKLARAVSGQRAGLTVREMAQVRAIAATANLRTGSRRRALLFGGANAAAAAALAKRLGRDLLRVDLSAVVSKYIGETEKNLDRVFSDAAANGALLLFDEAEALFGKRTSVKDAHDRYSKIEINDLLQRIEAYDGIVVLASGSRLPLSITSRRRVFICGFPPRAGKLR